MEMAETEHVPDNTKCMDLAKDVEAAECAIMVNVVISSEAGPDLLLVPQVPQVAVHHIARTISIYFAI